METVRRGDIVRVRFDPVEGSEQGGERPALVISADYVNQRSPVILVAPITSKKTEKVYYFEAAIEPPDGGLTRRSKALLIQMRSVDKSRVTGCYGTVSPETMRRVDEALKIAVGLVRF
jgi:mRNA interferase MazF